MNKAKTEFLGFKFLKRNRGNEGDHSVKVRGQLIDKVETFKYVGQVAQEKMGSIVEGVASRNTCG